MNLVQNNLGDQGPGTGDPVMKFEDVGVYESRPIDLVVSVGNEYVVNNPASNKVNGNVGQFNLQADHQAVFEFCFVDRSKKSVTLDKFSITLHDIGARPCAT